MRVVGEKRDRVVLVDGNNIIHRIYHAFVEKDAQNNGTSVFKQIIKETITASVNYIEDINQYDKIIFFFDGKPSWRVGIDPEYKNTVKRKPLEFGHGINLKNGLFFDSPVKFFCYFLPLIGCDVYFGDQEEADDLIFSFCQNNRDKMKIVISSDKDFFQMVNYDTILYRPGVSGSRFFDIDAVSNYFKEKFGFHLNPSSVRMFKTLTGDSSDNIPGIPRLRKSAAVGLYGLNSIDELYKSGFPGLSLSEKDKMKNYEERIKMNWDLVGLRLLDNLDDFVNRSCPNYQEALKINDELKLNVNFSAFRVNGFKPRNEETDDKVKRAPVVFNIEL